MTKVEARNVFFNETKGLSEEQLEAISKAISVLLGSTFVVRSIKSDATHFYIINTYYSAVEAYLAMSDVTLGKAQDVYFIKTEVDSNRYRLYKLDTILLLILRKIDFDVLKKVSVTGAHSTTVGEILSRLKRTEIYSEKTYKTLKTDFKSALFRLRHYKIIGFQTADADSLDAVVIIYPTITLLVRSDNVENLGKQLEEYKYSETDSGGETDEESTED